MRIERLTLENFRRFRHVDLELPDGVIALVGRNGAGKSTLLEAIGWCLYGHEAARTGKDLLKRRGAGPGESVRVHLAFRFGGHHHEITRELLGKSESHVAEVKVDGKVVVNAGPASHKECTQHVTRLFHMDREAFFTSLVARQRELSALTDAKASDRKRVLIGLLRLDAVDKAIVQARGAKRDTKAELAGLRSALQDVKGLKERLAATTKARDEARAKLAEAEAHATRLVEQVEEHRARREASRQRAEESRRLLAQVQMAAQRLAALQQEHARLQTELARAHQAAEAAAKLAPRLAQLPALQERTTRLAALRVQHEELARVRAEMKKAQDEYTRADAEAEAATAALAAAGTVRALSERVEKQRPRLEESLHAAQQDVAAMGARAQETARLLNEATEKQARIRAMGPESPCPTCTRPLREHHDELLHGFESEIEAHRAAIEEWKPRLDARRQEAADAKTQLAALAERESELRVKLAALAREEERVTAARSRAGDARARHARLAQQEKALTAEPYDAKAEEAARLELRELERLVHQHARLNAEAERQPDLTRLLAEWSERHAEAQAAEKSAREAHAALAFDAAAHDALEAATQALETRLGDARVLRERIAGELSRHQDEEARLGAEIARQAELAGKAETLQERALLLEQLAGDRDAGLLPEFKDHLIGRIRPLLSLHSGRLFRDLTEGRYADLEVGEDYDLLVHEDGQAYALERFSGGEGDLANLCLRLAVSQVVAERAGTEGFGFLALDEIFGSQDEIRKTNILRALKGLSGSFRQILLITHIHDVKDNAEHVLRVEALPDGTSRVVPE